MTGELKVNNYLTISAHWLSYETMRASGPGGQAVNTTDSAVRLRFDLRGCDQLVPPVKERLREAHPSACTQDGEVLITCNRHRSQHQNREVARQRLAEWIRAARNPPKPRRPTRPTRSSQRRRVDKKKQRGKIKAGRGRVRHED